jgi:hypothetical protein
VTHSLLALQKALNDTPEYSFREVFIVDHFDGEVITICWSFFFLGSLFFGG